MKIRFSSYDIISNVTGLQRLVGMRVTQIYDIDHKTYLLKLQRPDEKCMLLLESGTRFHSTAFEWPKNAAPSSFSSKLRKHLRNKRLESLRQLGLDRIVDFQFGSGEAAYHVILEMYDRGNIVLTDYEMTILNILRPRIEGEEIRFSVREKYPEGRARERVGLPDSGAIRGIFDQAKKGDTLKKLLNPHLLYGPSVIEHVLLSVGLAPNAKITDDFYSENINKIIEALQKAEELVSLALKETSKGYIIQKKEPRVVLSDKDNQEDFILTNQEFHPLLFKQFENEPYKEFDTFDQAVDEFFSNQETQKVNLKLLQQEREALKKLNNVKKDHDQRLKALQTTQEEDKTRAELIMQNQQLVDNAIQAVRAALASQASWNDIEAMLKEAQERGDPVANCVKKLKLHMNHITILLSDPYAEESDEERSSKPMLVDINLDHGAFANARLYFDQKRSAAKKQQKTVEAQGKAMKSAEKKTKQTLKEVQTLKSVTKARKVYWFEKFFWFISSENYLVIAGRDQIQNELIVKRYMTKGDIYLHAEISGASSVVIKNPTGQPVPPKTLTEAGVMAVSYSVAWTAKVVISAYWVHSEQVSKTAPTGEYLQTGSFMVRGKKNYLPPCHFVMGFSFLFKLEEQSIARHAEDRRVRATDVLDFPTEALEENETVLEIPDDDDNDEDDENVRGEENQVEDSKNLNTEIIKEEAFEDVDEEKEEKASLGDAEDVSEVAYPDTEIAVEHLTGNVQRLMAKPSDELPEKPVGGAGRRRRNTGQSRSSISEDVSAKETEKNQSQTQLKRGQRSKMKKIKEKYKDQDEEERLLRMQLLQSAGSQKESTKKGKKGKKSNHEPQRQPPTKPATKANNPPKAAVTSNVDAEDDDDALASAVPTDVDMLDSLTGCPVPEDELLFAVPVVAPYSALSSYKFKVKLTPGTGKRGKAAKTALSMFLRDKVATQREKDLLRSVKDQDLSRNIPGLVRVSAPQLHQKLKEKVTSRSC